MQSLRVYIPYHCTSQGSSLPMTNDGDKEWEWTIKVCLVVELSCWVRIMQRLPEVILLLGVGTNSTLKDLLTVKMS